MLVIQSSTNPNFKVPSNTERIVQFYIYNGMLLYDHYGIHGSKNFDIQNVRTIILQNSYVVLNSPNETIIFYSDVLYLNAYLKPEYRYSFQIIQPTRNTLEMIGYSLYDFFAIQDYTFIKEWLNFSLNAFLIIGKVSKNLKTGFLL